MTFLFELCVESLQAAQVAQSGGAGRIELCSRLSIGGVTPDIDLTAATIQALTIPVHVLIRPRGGDFCYSADEFAEMRRQVEESKAAGAAGLALGVLLADGRVDVARTRELVELAHPMNVTFHRAFDETPDLKDALENVVSSGANCLLTSGGARNVLAGAASIAHLREQAGERLSIMGGGGLRLESLVEVVRRAGLCYLHGSLLRRHAPGPKVKNGSDHNRNGAGLDAAQLEADLREAIRLIQQETAASRAMAQVSR